MPRSGFRASPFGSLRSIFDGAPLAASFSSSSSAIGEGQTGEDGRLRLPASAALGVLSALLMLGCTGVLPALPLVGCVGCRCGVLGQLLDDGGGAELAYELAGGGSISHLKNLQPLL